MCPTAEYIFFLCRPEICDSQCQGRELCNHLLQWWLLRDDRFLETGHHAEAMHLWLPPRWPDRQRGHQPSVPGCAGLRGVQGGDYLLPEGWWVSVLLALQVTVTVTWLLLLIFQFLLRGAPILQLVTVCTPWYQQQQQKQKGSQLKNNSFVGTGHFDPLHMSMKHDYML